MSYEGQHRGDGDAYDRYLAGMDASMRQKVALTAAHLLAVGRVADMGMGSGTGSHALAALYPNLQVVGVDVNPEMVNRASERYPRSNLSFVEGDIGTRCFEEASLDAILNSSVLHHVTSFSGYDHEAAQRALEVQVQALRADGVLVVRDFVDPGPGEVVLSLPDDGPAALFRRFSKEFRKLSTSPGFVLDEIEGKPGWARFRCSATIAAEFLLRKDYQNDWATEILEEYTYATQSELEGWLGSMGLRVLASTPIRNPWIVTNRLEGQYQWHTPTGEDLDHPATNTVVVGQKVNLGQGVRFESEPAPKTGYLHLSHWKRTHDGRVYDLVRRPNLTLDVLPWFQEDGRCFVLARRSYPRPIPGLAPVSIDGSTPSTWLSEPLVVQREDKPEALTVVEHLLSFPGISETTIRSVQSGGRFMPSPGGLLEQVQTMQVHLDPVQVAGQLEQDNGFTTAGTLRAIECQQLLRAAQVGGLPDARLECGVVDLLLEHGLSLGPWIGEEVDVADLERGPAPMNVSALLGRPPRRAFVEWQHSAGFLEVEAAQFSELDRDGVEVGCRVLEFVRPRPLSLNTVAVAVVARHQGQVLLGIEDDDLPAVQGFRGTSQVLVTPAWRLPHTIRGIRTSRGWIAQRLKQELGVDVTGVWSLGGQYHPSAGTTPETVWPLLVTGKLGQGERSLCWVPLKELLAAGDALVDGHLRIVARRAAHMLGLFEVA